MSEDAPFAYHLFEVLGRGGFGTVYRAELRGPSGFSKAVAVKLLNRESEANADLVQRLRDEARMLALVQHRAIVQVDRLVHLDDRWAVVMEYVPGFDLHTILKRGGPVPLGPALECVEEVAAALHVAYTVPAGGGADPDAPLNLVHRDVKPANIRISRSGAVKLLDFGIARARFPGREAQTESVRFGSMSYMSPLRLAMQDDGHAGDIYALGAVLAEALTGRAVGMSSHHPTAHREIAASALASLRDAGFSDDVVALIARTLAYDPAERPDARQLLTEARRIRTREAPGASLMEWVDTAFPALDAEAPGPDEDDVSGRVLHETGIPDGATISSEMFGSHAADEPQFHLGAILDGPTEPQVRPPRPGGARRWPVLVGIGAVAAIAAWWLGWPSSSGPSPAPPPGCTILPITQDRTSIRGVDVLFRGWQALDIDLVGDILAPGFERRDGATGHTVGRDTYLAQRRDMFERLAEVRWTGPLRDEAGLGLPVVVDDTAVRCLADDHVRVVVRYDWAVTSRAGRETEEEAVLDAYELDGGGRIVSNVDYSDLDGVRAWRDGCCGPSPAASPTDAVRR